MSRSVYTLFDTALGPCGLVWKASGDQSTIPVTGFQLPEATPEQAESRIQEKWAAEQAPDIPLRIQEIIDRVRLHCAGKVQDFGDVELELEGVGEFTRRIYAAARAIPSGQTRTYGQLAAAAGHAGAAQAVGTAMRKNPIPLIIPCHRVLAAGNQPGGFSAHGGLATKAKLLELEGASVPAFQQLDLGI